MLFHHLGDVKRYSSLQESQFFLDSHTVNVLILFKELSTTGRILTLYAFATEPHSEEWIFWNRGRKHCLYNMKVPVIA